MSKNTLYIKPNIQVVTLSPMPIMAGSAIPVSENGEADAKLTAHSSMRKRTSARSHISLHHDTTK